MPLNTAIPKLHLRKTVECLIRNVLRLFSRPIHSQCTRFIIIFTISCQIYHSFLQFVATFTFNICIFLLGPKDATSTARLNWLFCQQCQNVKDNDDANQQGHDQCHDQPCDHGSLCVYRFKWFLLQVLFYTKNNNSKPTDESKRADVMNY